MEDPPSVPSAGIWFTYILECSDGSYYVGFTSDLQARIETHQAGAGPAYTAARLPVSLAYSEQHSNRADAFKRKRQFKGWAHAKKTALVQNELEGLRELSRSRE